MRQTHIRQEQVADIAASTSIRRRAAVDFAAATAFAVLTAIGARVQFHLPFTPVPVTGQVFCVLFAGAVLGPRLGFVSQVEYLATGAAGLPIFAHGGGLPALLGPTGGYLIAFPLAAAVAGFSPSRLFASSTLRLLSCLFGVAIIHILGASWYGLWLLLTVGPAGLLAVLAQAVYPFVLIDVAKAGLAAAAAPMLAARLTSPR